MVPVSKHLMDTESGFEPWDLSKAHILVSSPEEPEASAGSGSLEWPKEMVGMDSLNKDSNKSPFGSVSHFVNIGS